MTWHIATLHLSDRAPDIEYVHTAPAWQCVLATVCSVVRTAVRTMVRTTVLGKIRTTLCATKAKLLDIDVTPARKRRWQAADLACYKTAAGKRHTSSLCVRRSKREYGSNLHRAFCARNATLINSAKTTLSHQRAPWCASVVASGSLRTSRVASGTRVFADETRPC